MLLNNTYNLTQTVFSEFSYKFTIDGAKDVWIYKVKLQVDSNCNLPFEIRLKLWEMDMNTNHPKFISYAKENITCMIFFLH